MRKKTSVLALAAVAGLAVSGWSAGSVSFDQKANLKSAGVSADKLPAVPKAAMSQETSAQYDSNLMSGVAAYNRKTVTLTVTDNWAAQAESAGQTTQLIISLHRKYSFLELLIAGVHNEGDNERLSDNLVYSFPASPKYVMTLTEREISKRLPLNSGTYYVDWSFKRNGELSQDITKYTYPRYSAEFSVK